MKSSQEKFTFIFDFDETISKLASITEILNAAVNYDQQKATDLQKMIHETRKIRPEKGPIIHLIIDEVLQKMDIKNITKEHYNLATDRISKNLTEEMPEIIRSLIKNGHEILIIGGGMQTCELIYNSVKNLGILRKNIYSGETSFDKNGNLMLKETKIGYINCETKERFSDKWIKSDVIKKLKNSNNIKGKIIHIGDGENDLEVWESKEIDYFIGFGVNHQNPIVKKNAPNFVENMDEFKKIIDKITQYK